MPSRCFGWYLTVLQLIFTLGWTVNAIYLAKSATHAGLPRAAWYALAGAGLLYLAATGLRRLSARA